MMKKRVVNMLIVAIGDFWKRFRKPLPVLILASECEPNIHPFWGHAERHIQFYRDCPANKGTNKQRLKHLRYQLQVRESYLARYRDAVSRLEWDCHLLRKAGRIVDISAAAGQE